MMLSYSMLLVDRQALSEHTTTSSSTKSLGQALRVSLVKPGAYLSESYTHFQFRIGGDGHGPQDAHHQRPHQRPTHAPEPPNDHYREGFNNQLDPHLAHGGGGRNDQGSPERAQHGA